MTENDNSQQQDTPNQNAGGKPSGNRGNNPDNRGGNTASRGFASMDEEQQRQIASKGGQAVSQNREHMAQIGRKGGQVGRSRPGADAANKNVKETATDETFIDGSQGNEDNDTSDSPK